MKTLKRERGQSLVELAISLLVLLYLLSGAVEFGIAFFQFVQLRDAAQEGALYGSMSPGPTPGPGSWAAIENRVRNASSSPINLADPSVKVTISVNNVAVWKDGSAATATAEACEGNALTVQVSYDHTVFMPFMSKIIGNTVPLNATVTDTILTPKCP
jgi:Flp pilus assembly protein TadG